MSGLFCGLIILHFVWVNLVFLLKPGVMKVKMSETGSYLSVSVHFRPKFSLPSLFPDQLLAVQVWTVRRSAESQKNFFLLHYLHYLRLVFELIGYTICKKRIVNMKTRLRMHYSNYYSNYCLQSCLYQFHLISHKLLSYPLFSTQN